MNILWTVYDPIHKHEITNEYFNKAIQNTKKFCVQCRKENKNASLYTKWIVKLGSNELGDVLTVVKATKTLKNNKGNINGQ